MSIGYYESFYQHREMKNGLQFGFKSGFKTKGIPVYAFDAFETHW